MRINIRAEKSFQQIEEAYKACKDAGIFFANNYGNLMAFDSKLVAGYGDDAISPGGEYEAFASLVKLAVI